MVVAVNNVIEQREEKRGRMFSEEKDVEYEKKIAAVASSRLQNSVWTATPYPNPAKP